MSRSRTAWGIVLALAGTVNCGAVPSPSAGYDPTMPPTGPAYLTLPSDSGDWRIALWTFPQPPAKGLTDVLYQVTDNAGDAVDGLMLTVVPWMPAHGHGTSVAPGVTTQGQGRYLVSPVYLYLAGRWELRTTISRDVASDGVVFAIDVP